MELTSLILCDCATVREGLLHVLGGGITRMWRDHLPAPLGAGIALIADLDQDEVVDPHQISIVVTDPDGIAVAQAMGAIQLPPQPHLETGEHVLAPFSLTLHALPVVKYGMHTITVVADAASGASLRFWVLHPEEMQLPPLQLPGV